MKIFSVNKRYQEKITSAVKIKFGNDFSASLDMAKKEHAEKELTEMLNKINKISFVLKHYYKVSRDYGRYSSQVLIRVEAINKKIEELTDQFIKQQKSNIDFIKKIDDISGLLLQLYI